jgi:hypothetical protein
LQHDWRCNIDYSPLWSAFKMKKKEKKKNSIYTNIWNINSLGYTLPAIVMLFLRAKVIPVNPQIHGNVMCPSVCAVCTCTRYHCFLEISSRYTPLWSAFKMKKKEKKKNSIYTNIWNINLKIMYKKNINFEGSPNVKIHWYFTGNCNALSPCKSDTC